MNDGGPRTYFASGAQGSGKSYRLSLLIAELLRDDPVLRVLVLDLPSIDERGRPVEGQWPYGVLRGRVQFALARTANGARTMLLERGHRFVVVRPGLDLEEPDSPTRRVAGELADIARQYPGEVLLVLPEAHLAMPAGGWKVPPGMVHVLHRSRHIGVRLLCDTQHPSQVNVRIRREARWYVHATQAAADYDSIAEEVKDTLGREHVPRVLEVVRSLDAMPPGFHIVLDGARSELEPRR